MKTSRVIKQNAQFTNEFLNDDLFKGLKFDLVLYDEIEKFRKYKHPDFNYPYERRKSKLNSFSLDSINSEFDSET